MKLNKMLISVLIIFLMITISACEKSSKINDTELIAIWRLYSKIRIKLVPYLKTLVQEAHESGTPIARPLFLVYPEQQKAWEDWQTYLLGPDILVSEIW